MRRATGLGAVGHTLSDIFGVPSERTIQAPVGPSTHKGPSTPNPTPCHYILPSPCPTPVSTMPSFRGASFGSLKTVRNRGDPCIFATIHLSCIAYLHPTYLREDAKHGSSALQPRSIYQEKPTIVHSKVYGGWCLFRHHSPPFAPFHPTHSLLYPSCATFSWIRGKLSPSASPMLHSMSL